MAEANIAHFSPTARNLDYNHLSRALNFAVGKTVVCQNITIRDDRTQEMDENFIISLTRRQGLDSRIVIDQGQGRVTIIDSDRKRERERERGGGGGGGILLSVSDLQLLKWDLKTQPILWERMLEVCRCVWQSPVDTVAVQCSTTSL